MPNSVPLSGEEVADILEDVATIFCTPVSLLKGKGGIRDTEVAQARRVAWWVLKRRGLTLEQIGLIFSRRWDTIWTGIRDTEKELTDLQPPAWAIDVLPLAHVTFEDALRWALRACGEPEDGDVFAYCVGTLYSGGSSQRMGHHAAPVARQLQGLTRVAGSRRVRQAVLWVFHTLLGSNPEYSICYQAQQIGAEYVE